MYLHAVKGLPHGFLDLLLAMPEARAVDDIQSVEDADGDTRDEGEGLAEEHGHGDANDEEEVLVEEEGLEHDPGRVGDQVLIQGAGHGVLVFVFT